MKSKLTFTKKLTAGVILSVIMSAIVLTGVTCVMGVMMR